MRNPAFAFALSLAAAAPCGLAFGDELTIVEPAQPAASVALPRKGEAQSAVLRGFGEPRKRYAPVGGDAPRHPPITRWDYAGFAVFFEHAHVVDAVVPGQPAPVFHTETLRPAGVD